MFACSIENMEINASSVMSGSWHCSTVAIADLCFCGHETVMRQHWPPGIPTLKHDGHSLVELEQILIAVRRVETEVGAGWVPNDVTSRSGAINRARQAWKQRDEHELWVAAAQVATVEQCRDPDITIDALIAQFSIEQANSLYEAAGQ